ncbi:hypothetical protein COX08_02700 [Candidatus Beckwithbacteria bacterium CG23_combo_of_CG06-09_8_20_14_all_34_8]|uniref:Thioredoxin-like fold domain-containing protein n=1 Tax=Candidatus Beckwithbacteria bacterium CG23_combo_of_CG06-09_8_20_14_all_34_8 TaxID=1974497 RepID=A0A2H0B618_9BACT|nr:MAG: hypothetical protein COX08_02700 [Candidatus Beckwithbacteria bacterium CG23_combo_of_CG06-09_8_20_14_all_34_8]
MKKLTIEWKHFDKNGKTCVRCGQTGKNIHKSINQIRQDSEFKDIDIKFIETKLPQRRMNESNQILINGVLIEKLLPNITVGKNYCDSCSDLINEPGNCNCRTINQDQDIYEDIPVDLIKQAIKASLNSNVINISNERINMNIQVLGSGCPTCKKLHELTVKAVAELGLKQEVEYNTDVSKIIEMGVMSSPVLAIDGKPALVGFVPDIEKIKEVISGADKGATLKSGGCSCGGNC